MSKDLTPEQQAAALTPPSSRPRAPRNSGGGGGQAAPQPTADETPSGSSGGGAVSNVTPLHSSNPAGSSAARLRHVQRSAEQAFLPLVSKVAKLAEQLDEAAYAVEEAKAAGVDVEELRDVLKSVARKNKVKYKDLPESIRAALAEGDE